MAEAPTILYKVAANYLFCSFLFSCTHHLTCLPGELAACAGKQRAKQTNPTEGSYGRDDITES
jgi:hypothetical protein